MSLLLALTLTGATTAPDIAGPFDLFEEVCISGSAEFDPEAIEQVNPASLPSAARQLAMLSLWLDAYDYGKRRYPRANEMPEKVFRLKGQSTYLATPDTEPNNPIQAACTVFVSGNRLADASRFLARISGEPEQSLSRNALMTSYKMSGYRLISSTIKGWTLVSAVPEAALGSSAAHSATSLRTED